MIFKTSDLCDQFAESKRLQIAEPLLRSFGGHTAFSGRITTLKVFEDPVKIREILGEKSEGGVLVVDGGGSHRCALLGADLAKLACDHGWEGIIVYGCIRDSVEIGRLPLGVRALHTHPLRSHKRGTGERDILITFAGVNFRTGHYLYADEDGIVVADDPLV
ncbi:regulator of ribonuclease activity A [Methylomagnum ishizawai]|uniref:4-hydroxy-4-methyl-2-oxoglutarate aldolase n=1 Tax=Methylomagnum ishizawai TaxID=1760988 RepID=A0A1Y6CVV3_9GAMM|nr:ribonuclease E activity regulator RraA [Methylomagnum ishizawai]SMF94511.1 regulator of ribonuclease activity A [Methylomagnum ishizawai]